MIHQLRKKHLLTWSILAMVVPIGFIAALAYHPDPTFKSQPPVSLEETGTWTLKASNENLEVMVDNEKPEEYRMRVAIKKPFQSPFVVVYQNDLGGPLLGRIEGSRMYAFRVQGNLERLVFYDEIKKSTLLTVQLY